jgi:hypothetical protein
VRLVARSSFLSVALGGALVAGAFATSAMDRANHVAVPHVGKPSRGLLGPNKFSTCDNATFCHGKENKGTGYAIEGLALNNAGIFGQTNNPSSTNRQQASGVYGVDGSTDGGGLNSGVLGVSANGTGVSGTSTNDTGVIGSGLYGVVGVGSLTNANSVAVGDLLMVVPDTAVTSRPTAAPASGLPQAPARPPRSRRPAVAPQRLASRLKTPAPPE